MKHVLLLALLFCCWIAPSPAPRPVLADEAKTRELTFAEWDALVNDETRERLRKTAAQISKRLPKAQRIDRVAKTYLHPEAGFEHMQQAARAVATGDDEAAVEAWLTMFQRANVDWAHASGHEASPAVLREVAAFWLPINEAQRDAAKTGSADYRLWDAAVTATKRKMQAK